MKKYFRQIIAALGVILSIGGVVALGGAVDSRYAKTVEVAEAIENTTLVSERLDRKILQDKIDYKQKQIYNLLDRWAEYFVKDNDRRHDSLEELKAYMNEDARARLREYENQLEDLKAQLAALDNDETI